ncbi:YybH family protein, partial [Allomesorhizobium camelthorni]
MNDHARIQSTIDAMTSAFARGDIDGVMATYEPDAVVVGQPGKPVSGTPALREMFAGFIALNPKFTFTSQDIVQAKDIAL